MAVNWDKAFETDNGIIIDGVVYVGSDSGVLTVKDTNGDIEFTLQDLTYVKEEVVTSTEVTIPAGFQHVLYQSYVLTGTLTINGKVVVI